MCKEDFIRTADLEYIHQVWKDRIRTGQYKMQTLDWVQNENKTVFRLKRDIYSCTFCHAIDFSKLSSTLLSKIHILWECSWLVSRNILQSYNLQLYVINRFDCLRRNYAVSICTLSRLYFLFVCPSSVRSYGRSKL